MLPDLSLPDVESDCSISILLLKVRCDTIHLCRCTVFLKAVQSFVSVVSTYFDEFKGVTDGSVGDSIPMPLFVNMCM